MTTSPFAMPFAKLLPEPPRKKRILLVDASRAKRNMRAEAMRKLGIDVDIAVDIDEARYWWRADLYHLVLLDVDNELKDRDRFCEDIRGAKPPQQLAFLVGAPGYLSDSPGAGMSATLHADGDGRMRPAQEADSLSGPTLQRWGILEASRRISAVRSLFNARTQARRNRPEPPRDSEIRYSRHAEEVNGQVALAAQVEIAIATELKKEEMQ
jgi:CheY-like chemotaxis protein